ncbi:MAG: hypothetical protein QG585_5 [Patescibacteria group bacterium]|jgi:hypothetical protein|nr:hypothetical protein [Patescibacteria group bacterium]
MKLFSGKRLNLLLAILLVGAISFAVYLHMKNARLEANPDALAEEESKDLAAEVGRFILLPKGEIPTVATVSDPEKLKDKPFFAKAKVGDKVLLYPVAKKAFLYDPVAKKVLEVAPINVGGEIDKSLEVDDE